MPSDNDKGATVPSPSSAPPKEEAKEEAEEVQKEQETEQDQTAPSPADSRSEEGEARSEDSPRENSRRSEEDGHNTQSPSNDHNSTDAPLPLPNESLPGAQGNDPPLPNEAPPQQAAGASAADDGWSAEWDATNQIWYFYNRFTGVSQWDNPRVQTTHTPTATAPAAPGVSAPPASISQPSSVAGGYNPAIHGSWDPTAPYAQAAGDGDDDDNELASAADLAAYHAEMAGLDGGGEGGEGGEYYLQQATFNRSTGRAQDVAEQNPERHSDAGKSYRQMNAYFNVDQAANSHDGRSLKAERRGKQPTKKELSEWKQKRKARKEEKRRAWLRD